jgi:hypothetical protein
MLKDEARDARSEVLVASAGPATSFALGGIFIGLGGLLDLALANGSLLPTVAYYVGIVNIALALFNLLPGAPLDGGRILSGALWAIRKDQRRAQITAARAGRVVGGLLIALPVAMLALGAGFNPWTAFLGLFIIGASRREEMHARVSQSLEAHAIADLMVPLDTQVPEWTTVADLPPLLHGRVPTSVLLTGFGGRPSALLQTGVLRAVAPAAAATVRLRDVAIPLDRLSTVAPDTPARDALALGVPVLVGTDDTLLGVVGLDEVRHLTEDSVTRTASRS